MRAKREYIYVGEPIPKIDNSTHIDFILNYQRSVLLALVKRELLTQSQCERCMEELERLQNNSL
jgi:hypothetical protein